MQICWGNASPKTSTNESMAVRHVRSAADHGSDGISHVSPDWPSLLSLFQGPDQWGRAGVARWRPN